MKKYTIQYVELVTYKFEVMAPDEDSAEDAAYEFWGNVPEAEEHEYKDDVPESFVDRIEKVGAVSNG